MLSLAAHLAAQLVAHATLPNNTQVD